MKDNTEDLTQRIIIGRIGSAFGVHGWLKINSFTDPPENILQYSPWQIQSKQTWITINIADSKIQSNKILIKLNDCNSPEQAKLYANSEIAIWRDQLATLSDNEYYWSDLEGLSVVNTNGVKLGIVDHLMNTGANDVLVIKGAKDHLIPYMPGMYIIQVNLHEKKILVDWDEDF